MVKVPPHLLTRERVAPHLPRQRAFSRNSILFALSSPKNEKSRRMLAFAYLAHQDMQQVDRDGSLRNDRSAVTVARFVQGSASARHESTITRVILPIPLIVPPPARMTRSRSVMWPPRSTAARPDKPSVSDIPSD
jgi:hypothetical protein